MANCICTIALFYVENRVILYVNHLHIDTTRSLKDIHKQILCNQTKV